MPIALQGRSGHFAISAATALSWRSYSASEPLGRMAGAGKEVAAGSEQPATELAPQGGIAAPGGNGMTFPLMAATKRRSRK